MGAVAASPLSGLPVRKGTEMKYATILADPPWPFKTYVGDKVPARSKKQPYETMAFKDIANLPIQDIAADDCALFCWVTWPTIHDALHTVQKWGFTYKTAGFVWVKTTKIDPHKPSMGLGYWTRSNSEPCLLFTRGNPKRRETGKSVLQPIIEPRRVHSQKPAEARRRIMQLVEGPYVELFARESSPGWDQAFSNQGTLLDCAV